MADRTGSQLRSGSVTSEEVNQMLQKPPDDVFAFSSDGQTYTAPRCLVGTPVRKISEKDEYWKSGWLSLETFLAQEEDEEKAKAKACELTKSYPDNKTYADTYKRHSDNVSKHRKIREIFGPDTSYHPNQLVSKHRLPAQGLCSMDLMYKLACKVSDLRVLKDRGELAMDPWDFIRWRVMLQLQAKLRLTVDSGREHVKSIISQIFEGPGTTTSPRPYHDPLLRAAILRSAVYQGRRNSFIAPGDRRVVNRTSTITSHINSRPLVTSTNRPLNPSRLLNSSRVEKRQNKPSHASSYQGVNSFRAQQKARQDSMEGSKQ
ncbi:acyl- thioesterase ii [Fusarium longipes]|uniref:Acyl-thioesterase ii n=1 Tax=Fusarium longipes TaxID=694270 RepID=A0A395T3C2_9HYPO|nr:acyl- thioesterase ii [Fusarium longipes]